MMNNKHKNSGCGYSEQMVSYLYGEIGAAEKPLFEVHLENCPICCDELEAFSGVQFSVNDWKLKEFVHLETPLIEIPYEKTGGAKNKTTVSSLTISWLPGLRNYFSLSPARSLATASFAVLAVCAGIAFVALYSGPGNDVANSSKITNPVIAPTVEKTPERSNGNTNQNVSTDKDVKPVNEQKPSQPELAVAPVTKNDRIVKTPNNPRQVQRSDSTNLPKNNDMKRNNKNKNEVPPKIIEDDEEDETLRLAELFEEIDTVE